MRETQVSFGWLFDQRYRCNSVFKILIFTEKFDEIDHLLILGWRALAPVLWRIKIGDDLTILLQKNRPFQTRNTYIV